MAGLDPAISGGALDCRVHRIKSGGGLPGRFDPGTGNDGLWYFQFA